MLEKTQEIIIVTMESKYFIRIKQFLLIIVFFSCTTAEDKKNPIVQKHVLPAAAQQIQPVKSNLFEIVNIDYHEDWLQRIFVVIPADNVNDTLVIRQVICILKKSYQLDNRSNISFFSDKKYANYKDILFFNPNHLLSQKEYRNWLDDYYLGEYEFKTNQYTSFPVSLKPGRQKIYTLEGCSDRL